MRRRRHPGVLQGICFSRSGGAVHLPQHIWGQRYKKVGNGQNKRPIIVAFFARQGHFGPFRRSSGPPFCVERPQSGPSAGLRLRLVLQSSPVPPSFLPFLPQMQSFLPLRNSLLSLHFILRHLRGSVSSRSWLILFTSVRKLYHACAAIVARLWSFCVTPVAILYHACGTMIFATAFRCFASLRQSAAADGRTDATLVTTRDACGGRLATGACAGATEPLRGAK